MVNPLDVIPLVQEFSTEFTKELIYEWNKGMRTTALSLAQQKCPKSMPNRGFVGTFLVSGKMAQSFGRWNPGGGRTQPRLWTTIKPVMTESGLLVLGSDDPRTEWFEYSGVKPHNIIAQTPAGLMWKTPSGKTVSGWPAVMHPGFQPRPFLNPAIWEFSKLYSSWIPVIARRVWNKVLIKHGIIDFT